MRAHLAERRAVVAPDTVDTAFEQLVNGYSAICAALQASGLSIAPCEPRPLAFDEGVFGVGAL